MNTSYSNATKVEIYHKADENVGTMTLKGTPNITDRRFPVDTPDREIQLFRFKPIDSAGAMIGNEIMYTCKPDAPVDTTVTPTDPTNPIPVTPHTGPVETAAIVFFVSLLGYVVYRKVRKV